MYTISGLGSDKKHKCVFVCLNSLSTTGVKSSQTKMLLIFLCIDLWNWNIYVLSPRIWHTHIYYMYTIYMLLFYCVKLSFVWLIQAWVMPHMKYHIGELALMNWILNGSVPILCGLILIIRFTPFWVYLHSLFFLQHDANIFNTHTRLRAIIETRWYTVVLPWGI